MNHFVFHQVQNFFIFQILWNIYQWKFLVWKCKHVSLSMIRYQNSLLPMFTFEMKPNWCLCFTNFESPFLWDCSEESLKLGIWFAARPTHTTQCPARVGFGQSRSGKWRKNAIHSFREVQVIFFTWDRDLEMKVKWKWLEIEIEKWKWNEKASRSRSRNEISREFWRFQNLFLTYFVLGSAPSTNG